MCVSNVRHPHNIKISSSLQIYLSNIVRYSPTAAVTECSEWITDNTKSSSTCCLYTHTLMHVDTHSLYQSQGFCQRMCQRYQSYFSHRQFSRSQIRAKVEVCICHVHTSMCVCVSKSDLYCCPCVLPLFLFSRQTIVSVYLYMSRPVVCRLLHKGTQKLQTMQWALAEETDFCPTPTNRKQLLHPPHPTFVSHTHRGEV